MIEIDIRRPNRLKDFFHKLHSRSEDAMYSIVMKIPDKYIPQMLMTWLDRYTTKRINQLQHETIKQTWQNMHLHDALSEIERKKTAPSEE